MNIRVTFELWALNSHGWPYWSPIHVYTFQPSISRDTAMQDAIAHFTRFWSDDWPDWGIRVRVE